MKKLKINNFNLTYSTEGEGSDVFYFMGSRLIYFSGKKLKVN